MARTQKFVGYTLSVHNNGVLGTLYNFGALPTMLFHLNEKMPLKK